MMLHILTTVQQFIQLKPHDFDIVPSVLLHALLILLFLVYITRHTRRRKR